MDKKDVVYIHNGPLFSQEKEQNNAICSNMDTLTILSEVSQKEKDTTWYHLYVESEIWQKWTYPQNRNRLTDVKNRLMFAKKKGK